MNEHSLLVQPDHLETNRNSLVLRLPQELLEQIVVLAARLDENHNSVYVLPYSYVCRSWRNILISSPLLWRHINVHHPKWMTEFLLRSNSVPIYVKSYDSLLDTKSSGWVDLWSHHSHRITRINMFVRSPNYFKSIPSTLPSLTELNLRGVHLDDSEFFFPFHGLPALRKLNLIGISLRDDIWDLISGLTHFAWAGNFYNVAPSLQQIFGIITRSPMLCSISLGGDLRLSDDVNSTPVPYLFYLRELHIKAHDPDSPSTFHLLSKLQLPPSCQLTLEAHSLDLEFPLTSLLPPTVTRKLLISNQSRIQFSQNRLRLYELTDSHEEQTIFSLNTTFVDDNLLSAVDELCGLSNLTSLRICFNFRINGVTWQPVLKKLHSLVNLELTSLIADDAIMVLNILVNTSVVWSSEAVLCPQLSRLFLQAETPRKPMERLAIVPWLGWRTNRGAAISELCLKNFEVRPKHLKTLQSLVKVLKIDDVVKTWEEGLDDVDEDEDSDNVEPEGQLVHQPPYIMRNTHWPTLPNLWQSQPIFLNLLGRRHCLPSRVDPTSPQHSITASIPDFPPAPLARLSACPPPSETTHSYPASHATPHMPGPSSLPIRKRTGSEPRDHVGSVPRITHTTTGGGVLANQGLG